MSLLPEQWLDLTADELKRVHDELRHHLAADFQGLSNAEVVAWLDALHDNAADFVPELHASGVWGALCNKLARVCCLGGQMSSSDTLVALCILKTCCTAACASAYRCGQAQQRALQALIPGFFKFVCLGGCR